MRRTGDRALTVISAALLILVSALAVDAQQTARIDRVNPTQADPGQTVTISGSGFGGRNVRVTVGGTPAQVISATGSQATFAVPNGIAYGPTEIAATNPGGHTGRIAFFVSGLVNAPPVVNAGQDAMLTLPGPAPLNGMVKDDGLPQGRARATQWKKVTGPGSVTFANPNSESTTASFSDAGSYVLRLTATDSEFTVSDDVQISVTPANQAPLANAGADFGVRVTETAHLDGTASIDPDGDALTFSWTLVSIPAGSSATLTGSATAAPAFVADRPGTYVVQLVAYDGLLAGDPDTVTITTANTPPVASAGPDQTAPVATTITLDATGSSDVDGDALAYEWTIQSAPAGSAVTLSDPSALHPTFAIDQPGSYVLKLVVSDGVAAGAADTIVVSTVNSAPVANAGPDQTVLVTQTVNLNGGRSSDVDGDPLAFSWTLVSTPDGSTAVLANPAGVTPTFVVDQPGTYVAQLTVNDGTAAGAPDTVTITTANSAPVANAGADQSTLVNQTVTLDGSGSIDVDRDLLTYAWALVSVPAGSAASLSDPAAVAPSFVADRPGTYVAQLIVSESNAVSAADTVTITTLNSTPVADAGLDQSAVAGQVVFLTGAGSSDVDGDPLAFQWSVTSVPPGSSAVLVNSTSAGPSFTVDRTGTFVVQLIVNDGTVNSAPDTVMINTTNSAPVANAGPDQLNPWVGTRVTLDGSLSSDADAHTLTYSWSLTAKPAGSAAVLSDPAAIGPAFTADVAGDYVAQLIVNDGFSGSAPDTVLIRATDPPPITLPTLTVGGGLQTSNLNGLLGDANHGGVTVHLVSSEPARVLLATSPSSIGAASIDIPVANGVGSFSYYVQGADWVEGVSSAAAVTVTASATGFRDGQGTAHYVRPALDIINLPASTTSLSANVDFVVRVGVSNATGQMQSLQARRFGAPALVVTASNSNAAVAEIDHNGGIDGVQAQTSTIAAGQSNTPNNAAGGLEFDPRGVGSTTVTASIPGFTTLAAGIQTVTMSGPGITMPATFALGGGLQHGALQGSLGASQHGGVTVRIASSDPARVQVAANATTAGADAIDIPVANGATTFSFYVQGADWVPGASTTAPVTITASTAVFSNGTSTVNYVQPVLDVFNLSSSATSLSANADFVVRVGVGIGTQLQLLQARRFGAPALVVTATNSNVAVAEIDHNGGVDGAQAQTSSIAAGQSSTPNNASGGFEFDPLGSGTTIVRASIPNFVSLPAATVTVTVAAPAISLPTLEPIGGGLMYGGYTGTLGASQHGGVQVRLVSSDPSRVLLAATNTSPGAAEIDIAVANGTNWFSFFVVGTDWEDGVSSAATVTVFATASGFSGNGAPISYVRPTLDVGNLPASLSAGSSNRDFTIRVGIPNAANTALRLLQWRRPGGSDLVVTVTNGNASVADLDQNGGLNGAQVQTVRIVAGQSLTPFNATGGLELDPLAVGTTVLTATIPNFATAPATGFTVNVTP